MKKVVKYILLFLNLIAVLTLIGAFLAPMINPEKIRFFSFWGLVMPYSLIINILFIIYWVLKARFYFIISLLTIVLSWSTVKTSFPYHRSEKEDSEVEHLKVMSYNVRVFDRYNWSKEKNTVSDMLRFIKAQKSDIICLQEFGTSKYGQDGATEDFILNALGEYPHHYIHYAPRSRSKRHQQGLAILSRYPITFCGIEGDEDLQRGGAIYADIKINSNTIRVINAHFESVHLTNKYDIIEGIDSNNYKTRIKSVFKSINHAAIQHSINASDLIGIIEETSYPTILCADMNSTPVSYSYHKLRKQLDDAYIEDGTGFGGTYNGIYPFLRIDYIFHSKELSVSKYKRLKVNYSDHFPITTEFVAY